MTNINSATRRRSQVIIPFALASAVVGGAAHAGPTITYGDEGFVTLGYSVQIWAQNRDFTSTTDGGNTTDFFLRRNRITLSGQHNDYVGFYAQLEAGSDSRAGQDNRSVYYRDAYVTFDWTDSLRFIAGRFKNTFTRENLEACLEPLTLDRGEVISYTPFGGTRDTGVAMWGNLAEGMFQYRLMASDGREGDEVVDDGPRLTARAHVSLWEPEYDYGYRGTYLGTRKVLTIGAAYDYQADVAYADYVNRRDARDYTAWTGDVFLEYPTASGTITASAAYMDYSVDDAYNAVGGAAFRDPALPVTSELKGNYVKLGYLFPNKLGIGRLQLFARHENLDYGVDNGYYDNTWKSIGANYYINGQQLKLTFEYASVDYDRQHPTDPSLADYDQATLGFQLIF